MSLLSKLRAVAPSKRGAVLGERIAEAVGCEHDPDDEIVAALCIRMDARLRKHRVDERAEIDV